MLPLAVSLGPRPVAIALPLISMSGVAEKPGWLVPSIVVGQDRQQPRGGEVDLKRGGAGRDVELDRGSGIGGDFRLLDRPTERVDGGIHIVAVIRGTRDREHPRRQHEPVTAELDRQFGGPLPVPNAQPSIGLVEQIHRATLWVTDWTRPMNGPRGVTASSRFGVVLLNRFCFVPN